MNGPSKNSSNNPDKYGDGISFKSSRGPIFSPMKIWVTILILISLILLLYINEPGISVSLRTLVFF